MAGIPPVLDLAALDEASGFRIRGAQPRERVGASVASAGDINGDGFADIIVGAPGAPPSIFALTDYAAYVIFGRGLEETIGDSLVDTGLLTRNEGFRIVVAGNVAGDAYDGSEAGFDVSSAGDFNGDGLDDLMVSVPLYGADNRGATYIVFGKAGGFTDVTLGTGTSADWVRIEGAAAGDNSGHSVAALGDTNGDGFGDVLIGSPAATGNGYQSGVAHVVYGNGSGANIDLASLDASEGFRIVGESIYDAAGYSVSAAGDVNGDGLVDLLIGAPFTDFDDRQSPGSTYLVYGSVSGGDIDLANLTPEQGVRIDGPELTYSAVVASAGDVNGDGLDDLITGTFFADPDGRQDAGAAYVIFGKQGGLSDLDLANLAPEDGFRIIGAADGDFAGYSVASAGDFNGDGFADIVVGAPDADSEAGLENAGSVYVIFGKASGLGDIDLADLDPSDGFRIDGPRDYAGTEAGFSAASAGDMNGDGYSDLVLGTSNSTGGMYSEAGGAYVVYGEASSAVDKQGTAGDDRLFGGDFDDTLSGGDGNDVIGGRGGSDLLTGGSGRDSFVYGHGDARDIVADFRQGEDIIDLRSINIGNFSTVQELLSSDAEGNAVITTVYDGVTTTMTLTGISVAQLTAADFVLADATSQQLTGSDNDDDLFGGPNGDALSGEGGNDRLYGEDGYDSLSGGAGDDQLFGGADGDMLHGGAGADLLDGGEGNDTAQYQNATGAISASLAEGRGSGSDAEGDVYVSIENLFGSDFDDFLEGDDGANTILALDGDNVIWGLGGNDRLVGGSGSDTFYGGTGVDDIDGGAGIDYARYDDMATGVSLGFGGSGEAAGDVLRNIEVVIGSAFADRLGGHHAAQDFYGMGGDDELMGRGGEDVLDGGEGTDRAVFTGSRGDYFIAFDAATGTYIVDDLREGSPDGTDRVSNVETFVFADGAIPADSVLEGNPGPIVGDDGDNALTGTSTANEIRGLGGNDALSGLGGEDELEGGAGDDTIDGGTGFDTASYATAASRVAVSLAIAGAQDTGGAGTDTLASIEGLTGSAFDDALTGDAGANRLSGLAGNDRLVGGAGDDTLLGGEGDDFFIGGAGRDAFDGGEGFDVVSYETVAGPAPVVDFVVIEMEAPGWGDTLGDTYTSIEGVIGSDFDDFITGRTAVGETLIGGVGGDVLFGAGGGDTLIGGVGDDLLIASDGTDRLEGGDGIDIVSYSHGQTDLSAGVTINLADPSRNTGAAAGDSYEGIEAVLGSIADDTLIGDASGNILMGSWGSDVLIGGAGADVLNGDYFFPENIKYTVGYQGDTVPIPGLDLASYATATSGVVASLANSAINTGDAAGDTYVEIEGLVGSAFNDVLEGGQSGSLLQGGAGDDTLIGGVSGNTFEGGEGNDTAIVGGQRADYTITFDAATQTLILTGVYGHVTYISGVETIQFADVTIPAASLIPGDDNDNALIGTETADDLSGGGGNDSLAGLGGQDRLDGGSGDDALEGGEGNDSLLGGVGNDTLGGGAGADTLDGGAGHDTLSGAEGDDTLRAGDGDDTLSGGTGANTLDGGAGLDTASYASALAGVNVNLRSSGPHASGGGGVTDTLMGIESLVGSAFDDVLIGSSSDLIAGGAGNDLLADADVLDGGEGSDTVSYAHVAFQGVVVDLAIEGPQRFDPRYLEFQTLIGVENLIGSGWEDTLKGDGGANRLAGGQGNDILMGRGGDDILDGGAGIDGASYADASAGVTVDLRIGAPQGTGEGVDTLIGIENLTGSAFADTLKGTGERNVLIGGAGDDLLMGRGGGDRLEGGEGVDTASYAEATARVQVNLGSASAWFPDLGDSDQLGSIENVVGSAFADALTGSTGANALSGGGGSDRLTGGLGRDTLTGGADADVFAYDALAESAAGAGSRDIITDFRHGLDEIDLSAIDANPARSGDQGFRFVGTQEFRGREGEVRYQTFDQAGTASDFTLVSIDVDGDRIADMEIEIVGIVSLTSGDFML